MPTITEGNLTFTFPDDWSAVQYDDWSHYRNQFIKVCKSTKAVDLVAVDSGNACGWLIEIKDYRRHRRTKTIDLATEVAEKVRDTLAGLVSARFRANDDAEQTMAGRVLKSANLRIVLHLEQPQKVSKLFPRAIDPADVLQRLKQLVKAVDPHPLVVDRQSKTNTPWTVA